MLKPTFYHFTNGTFSVSIFALSLIQARRYVRRSAISVVAYRTVKYIGNEPMKDKTGWIAADARQY